jgi:hypothetical protein
MLVVDPTAQSTDQLFDDLIISIFGDARGRSNCQADGSTVRRPNYLDFW